MKIVIFGSSGDLAKRKLFPALAKIDLDKVRIIGYARTKYNTGFPEILQEVGNYSPDFLARVIYVRGAYENLSKLEDVVDEETIFYFSVPPSVYTPLLKELSKFKYRAVAIEKPFGSDKQEFSKMKEFKLDKAMFIDHYLLKPMVVAIPQIIWGSQKLQSLMNNRHISNVEIISKEVIGGEGRHYFDRNGIVRDIAQNHMAELLGVIASDGVENSKCMGTVARMKVFDACVVDKEHCIYGQYESYSKELHKESNTETFCVLPIYVNSERWSKTPFIITAGKGMNEKKTEIVLEFKREAFAKCIDLVPTNDDFLYRVVHANDIATIRLIFNVYPRCEIFLEIKIADEVLEYVLYGKHVIDDIMHSHYGTLHDHEIVFNSLIKGTSFSCVNSSEAELLWKIFDPVLSGKEERKLFYYSKGVDTPIEAENIIRMIKKH